MIFFKHPKVTPKLNISVNDNQIDQVDEFNFLGITIDQSVTFIYTTFIKRFIHNQTCSNAL